MRDYGEYDAVGLAELVRLGEVTPTELLEAAIARLDVTEPVLQAVHQRLDEMGREAATRPPTGTLAGVPFLVKDIAQDIRGVPTGAGNRSLLHIPAERDSEYVVRLRRAGLVIFGKTATPELALKGITEPEGFEPTRNPINPEHTPGAESAEFGLAGRARRGRERRWREHTDPRQLYRPVWATAFAGARPLRPDPRGVLGRRFQ